MDQAHDQRPGELIQPHAAEPAVEPRERRRLGGVGMRVRLVVMLVAVDVVAVAVRMRVGHPVVAARLRHAFADAMEHALQCERAQHHQHHAHRELEREAHPRRDDPAQEDDAAAHGQDGERVADAPGDPDERGVPRPPVPGDDGLTAITWSGSVACRMPRKNPSATTTARLVTTRCRRPAPCRVSASWRSSRARSRSIPSPLRAERRTTSHPRPHGLDVGVGARRGRTRPPRRGRAWSPSPRRRC